MITKGRLSKRKLKLYQRECESDWGENNRSVMKKKEAEKIISEKIKELLPCPFCGKVPTFDCRVDKRSRGSIGHFSKRNACCSIMGCGDVELFFCNDNKPANYELWANMTVGMVNDWNRRQQ